MDTKLIVHSDPNILGGTPLFAGSRVPVRSWITSRAAIRSRRFSMITRP